MDLFLLPGLAAVVRVGLEVAKSLLLLLSINRLLLGYQVYYTAYISADRYIYTVFIDSKQFYKFFEIWHFLSSEALRYISIEYLFWVIPYRALQGRLIIRYYI